MIIAVSTTVYERIISALKSSQYEGSERAWCATIGLSPTYLSQLQARCKKNPNAMPDATAALKISEALGMAQSELLGISKSSSNPERRAAIAKARALGFSADAIAIGSDATPPPGATELWWFSQIEAAETLLQGRRPSAVVRSLSK
jgi:hypothetical protein